MKVVALAVALQLSGEKKPFLLTDVNVSGIEVRVNMRMSCMKYYHSC